MGYYAEKLSGERLRECYEVAPGRVKRYLEMEIEFLLKRLKPEDSVLELGCGYGRVALSLARASKRVVGVDTARESLILAKELAGPRSNCEFLEMDASDLKFPDRIFDVVVCVQNGICSFNVDQKRLLSEAIRVTRRGGRVIFSTYSDRFWPHRLEWFEIQASRGLVGEIDYSLTGGGVIACKDGFQAGILHPGQIQSLCDSLGISPEITEVDGSSLFFELNVNPTA